MDWEHQGWLRVALIDHYERDIEFAKALEALAGYAVALSERPLAFPFWTYPFWHWRYPLDAESEAAAGYVAAIATTATTFGLDRVREGEELIHRWCASRVQWGSHWTTKNFTMGAGFGGFSADLNTRIQGFENAAWHPTRETPKKARARFRAKIDEEIDRIAAEAIKAGYKFRDRKPTLPRDIEWLFWKLRFRRSYATIAELANVGGKDPVGTVTTAVEHIADEIGVQRAGW